MSVNVPVKSTLESKFPTDYFKLNSEKVINLKQKSVKKNFFLTDLFFKIKNFFYTCFTSQGRLELREVKLFARINEQQDKIAKTKEKIDGFLKRIEAFNHDFAQRKKAYFESTEGVFRFSQYRKLIGQYEGSLEELDTLNKSHKLLDQKFKAHRLNHYGVQIVTESLKQFKGALDKVAMKCRSHDAKCLEQAESELKQIINDFVDFNLDFETVIHPSSALSQEKHDLMSSIYKLKDLVAEQRKLSACEVELETSVYAKQKYIADQTQEAKELFHHIQGCVGEWIQLKAKQQIKAQEFQKLQQQGQEYWEVEISMPEFESKRSQLATELESINTRVEVLTQAIPEMQAKVIDIDDSKVKKAEEKFDATIVNLHNRILLYKNNIEYIEKQLKLPVIKAGPELETRQYGGSKPLMNQYGKVASVIADKQPKAVSDTSGVDSPHGPLPILGSDLKFDVTDVFKQSDFPVVISPKHPLKDDTSKVAADNLMDTIDNIPSN